MMSYDVVVFARVSHHEMVCVTDVVFRKLRQHVVHDCILLILVVPHPHEYCNCSTQASTEQTSSILQNRQDHARPRFCHLQFCLQADVRGSKIVSKKLVANDILTWRFAYWSLRHQDLQIIMLGQQSVTEMQYSWTSLETSVFGMGWKGKMVENSLGLYFWFGVIYWKFFGWFSFDGFAMGGKTCEG